MTWFVSRLNASYSRSLAFTSVFVAAAQALKSLVRSLRHRNPTINLLELDDYLLKDIGLMRGDVHLALKGPLSKDPSARLRVFAVERRALEQARLREFNTPTAKTELSDADLTIPTKAVC